MIDESEVLCKFYSQPDIATKLALYTAIGGNKMKFSSTALCSIGFLFCRGRGMGAKKPMNPSLYTIYKEASHVVVEDQTPERKPLSALRVSAWPGGFYSRMESPIQN